MVSDLLGGKFKIIKLSFAAWWNSYLSYFENFIGQANFITPENSSNSLIKCCTSTVILAHNRSMNKIMRDHLTKYLAHFHKRRKSHDSWSDISFIITFIALHSFSPRTWVSAQKRIFPFLIFKLFILLPHHFDVLHALNSFNFFTHTHRHKADLHLIRTSHVFDPLLKLTRCAKAIKVSEAMLSTFQHYLMCFLWFRFIRITRSKKKIEM